MLRFELVVKSGVNTLADITGVHMDDKSISMEDVNKVIEVEQYLERLFGLRFHINTVTAKEKIASDH